MLGAGWELDWSHLPVWELRELQVEKWGTPLEIK